MKNWKIINNEFIDEQGIVGQPSVGDTITNCNLSYSYKMKYKVNSFEVEVDEPNIDCTLNLEESPNSTSIEDLSEFEMLDILYKKALENER